MQNKVTRINKSGGEISKQISYRWQFIESSRFMASSLSNLVNEFIKSNANTDKMIKKCEAFGIKYKKCFL